MRSRYLCFTSIFHIVIVTIIGYCLIISELFLLGGNFIKRKLAFFLTVLLVLTMIPSFNVFAITGDVTTPAVVAANDWNGNPSWQSATMTETATAGTYILKNTDANAGYAFNWTPATGTISTYDKTTYVSSMVVPGKVGDVNVTTIASGTFQKPVTLSYMVVSENVTTLKSTTFRESGLIGIRLPKSLTTIESNNFLGCTKLAQINLEDTSLTSIGTTAFKQAAVVSLTFPATLTSILRETFYGCTSLESLTFLGTLTNCDGIGSTSGNQAAFYGTTKLKTINFFGNTAPTTVSGFAYAGVDYQITVYYPQGGPGYDTPEFIAGFRTGTTFIKKLKAQASLQGKPNIGEKLTASFAYAEPVVDEQNSTCYWQRSDNVAFTNAEKISEDISMKSGEPAEHTITEADRGKYIRFYVMFAASAGEYTANAFCISEPTRQIQAFSVDIEIAGAVVGTQFYTTEGITSYGAVAKAFNSTNEVKDFNLISAWYTIDKNELVDYSVDSFSAAAGTGYEGGFAEATFEGTRKTHTDISNLKIKLFAFDNMSKIEPLTDTKTYSGIFDVFNEITNTNTGGLYTESQISYIRNNINQGLEPWKSSYDMLIQNADAWINEEPSPQVNWYVPGYYTNADGHIAARSVMMNDLKSAYACGLAYQFTGKAKYADQAVRILNAWSKTLVTMGSEDSGLVFAYVGNGFPMTAELVKGYRDWKTEDKGLFDSWMKNVYLAFADKSRGSGNSGDWGIFARVAGRAYLGDKTGMQPDITELERLITDEIAVDGSLPMENARAGNSVWYTYFALAPMTAACQVIYNTTGVDYFHWVAPNGRSVKQALDTYFYYCNHIDEWPYDPNPAYPSSFQGNSWPLPLWEAMGGVYNNQDYINFIAPYRPLFGPFNSDVYHHMAWFYSSLMYGALQLGNGLPTYQPTN